MLGSAWQFVDLSSSCVGTSTSPKVRRKERTSLLDVNCEPNAEQGSWFTSKEVSTLFVTTVTLQNRYEPNFINEEKIDLEKLNNLPKER